MPPNDPPWLTSEVCTKLMPYLTSATPPARIILKPVPDPFPTNSPTGPTHWSAAIFYPSDPPPD